MRLILQGQKPKLSVLPDQWLVFAQDGTFVTSPYLTKGYNRIDYYVAAGGGGGGNGGKSFYGGAGEYTPGGGGGGGGGGKLVIRTGVDLFGLPIVIPYHVGAGGKGSSSIDDRPEYRAGYDGDYSSFHNSSALGGSGGGGGVNGGSTLVNGGFGGGGGAGGVPVDSFQTYPGTISNPPKGSGGTQGAGDGGNGGTTTILATAGGDAYDGTAEALPYYGEAYADAIIFGGGGGGGGGPGIFRTNGSEYFQAAGASGGHGWNSVPGSTSPQAEGGSFSASGIYKAGGGGGGGFGHNFSSVYRMSNLLGQPVNNSSGSGLPSAGGCGGSGGISQTDARLGAVGRTGASGCILLRLYAAS